MKVFPKITQYHKTQRAFGLNNAFSSRQSKHQERPFGKTYFFWRKSLTVPKITLKFFFKVGTFNQFEILYNCYGHFGRIEKKTTKIHYNSRVLFQKERQPNK